MLRVGSTSTFPLSSVPTEFLTSWFRCFPASLVLHFVPLVKGSPTTHVASGERGLQGLEGMIHPSFPRGDKFNPKYERTLERA